ncbi:Calcium-dependent protein kinase 1 [Porphyridium purpureum]|uniref:Calcium-dependent protein kinase 1 n=1 Tax=Porphyridium purpureum TaxID=35688 RepID=A0A5J4YYH7_PORPP|nr:Calcium-dependent protein kinase 1 [Porphyridium purpureum]|eukprot:POR7700..scf209_3
MATAHLVETPQTPKSATLTSPRWGKREKAPFKAKFKVPREVNELLSLDHTNSSHHNSTNFSLFSPRRNTALSLLDGYCERKRTIYSSNTTAVFEVQLINDLVVPPFPEAQQPSLQQRGSVASEGWKSGTNARSKSSISTSPVRGARRSESFMVEKPDRGTLERVLSPRYAAVKAIHQSRMEDVKELECAQNELQISRMLAEQEYKHPNLVQVLDVKYFEEKKVFFVLMELLTGGSLRSVLRRHPDGMPEGFVCEIMFQVLDALSFLHRRMNVAHRDIKPENVMLRRECLDPSDPSTYTTPDPDLLCIIDFNNAAVISTHALRDAYGTLEYAAPEVLEHSVDYSEKCDLWSAGCVMYEALTGRPLFDPQHGQVAIESIFVADIPSQLSADHASGAFSATALDLLTGLLNRDASARLSADQAMNHKWFAELVQQRPKKQKEKEKEMGLRSPLARLKARTRSPGGKGSTPPGTPSLHVLEMPKLRIESRKDSAPMSPLSSPRRNRLAMSPPRGQVISRARSPLSPRSGTGTSTSRAQSPCSPRATDSQDKRDAVFKFESADS